MRLAPTFVLAAATSTAAHASPPSPPQQSSRAEVRETPIALALVDPWLGLPGGNNQSVTGLDLGLATTTPLDLTGLGFVVGFSLVQDSVAGVQLAGLGNLANASRATLQVAGLFNYVTQGPVIQIAGAVDVAGDISGAQLAPVNLVDDLDGVQLGLVNRARRVRGLQIGLVNYARRLQGVQLGVVNIDRSSRLPFTLLLDVGW